MKSKTTKAAGKASLDPLVRCCGSCRFWDESWMKENIDRDETAPEVDGGECRRFPPPAERPGCEWEGWCFPVTLRRDWCGEYSPNAESEALT